MKISGMVGNNRQDNFVGISMRRYARKMSIFEIGSFLYGFVTYRWSNDPRIVSLPWPGLANRLLTVEFRW